MKKLNRNTLNIEEFKKGNIIINCKTEKESIDLFKYLDDKGIIWCSRDKLTKYNIKNYEFGRETCYRFDETGLSYSSKGFYDRYYKIYEKYTCYDYDENCISTDWYENHEFQIYEWEIFDEETNMISFNEGASIISFDEIERTEFKKKIYISHSYSGLKENKRDIEYKVKRLVKEYPNYVFISPVHTFGYLYDNYPYDISIDLCIELLKMCDEMWIIDKDFVNSKGVMVEREWCLCNKIPVRLIEIND